MNETKNGITHKKRNQTFAYLYVMAIIMVIDDHCSTRIGFLSSIFPYNSFYMPLFVFASGYFFKRMGILDNVKYKVKKLLIPYVIWNIVALVVAFMLDRIFLIDWFKMPTTESIVRMFLNGSSTSVNGAAWFVIMLFWVSIFYNILKNLFKDNKFTDTILTIFFIITGFISIYLCTQGYNAKGLFWLFILKTTFYIQFFHYGFMFKKHFEKLLLKHRKILVCIICIFINGLLILIFGDKINFYSTSGMGGFNYWYLPLITSFTGIIFYYEIMEFLSKKIGRVKIIDFISRNTFVILETHLLFVNIPNFYVYLKILQGSTLYSDFNLNAFINNAWVRYSPDTRLIGFCCGLIFSLLTAFLIEKVKKYISNRKLSKQNLIEE